MEASVWLALAAILVTVMQVGFLFLEAGFVRSKNSINVAMKNIADFAIAIVAFFILGFALMFGTGDGFFAFSPRLVAFDGTQDVLAFLMFQAVFCGTAATIVSGAIAERMQFSSYLVATIPLTMLFYPIVGHWAWGSGLPGGTSTAGWLEGIGFIDYAGSSVVHVTGGMAALALLLIIGARRGRFEKNKDGEDQTIQGHSPVLAAAGGMLLMVGWLGFNTGGLAPGTDLFAHALANTFLAGSAGAVGGMVVGHWLDGHFRPDRVINGMLAGLVSITASAPYATGLGAIVGGAGIALLAMAGGDLLEKRGKVDDAVSAVAVHAMSGMMGTIAVPLLARPGVIENPLLTQLGIQAMGTFAIGGFIFVAVGSVGLVLNAVRPLRVTEEDEKQGLNVAEHGALLGHAPLTKLLEDINKGKATLGTRIEFDYFQEGGDLAEALNDFLDNVEQAERDASAKLVKEQQASIMTERRRADAVESVLERFQDDFATLVCDLRAQAESLDEQTGHLTDHAALSKQAVGEASDNARKTVSIAENMSEGAKLLAQTLDRVGEDVARARLAADHAGEASGEGMDMARTLEASATEIGQLVALIESISHQTHILAINANIEASRAGVAGKAFVVVSDEIRTLSERTSKASGEIGDIVESLTGLIGRSVAQFRAISDNVETVRSVADEAQTSVLDQRTTGQQLARLIDEAREISLSGGKSVEQVSERMELAGDATGKVGASADRVAGLAERIDTRFHALRSELTEDGDSKGEQAAASRDLRREKAPA